MGMVYFSGDTLSIDGRTPLPVNIDDFTVFITIGYLLSIIVMIIKPNIIVWTERITASVALLSALVLFLPLSPKTFVIALCIQFFCCCFMIGFETSIIVGLFTERTAVIHLSICYGISHFLVAILHNDFIKIDFSVFHLFSIAALVMMIIFFFKLPGNIWPKSVKKKDGIVAPKSMLVGIAIWAMMAAFIILFGNAISESYLHGVFIFYTSTSIFLTLIFFLWKFLKFSPFRVTKVYIAIGAMGFITAIISIYLPQLKILTSVLLGAGSIGCLMSPLIGNVLIAKHYPSRFLSPIIIGAAFLAVFIHATLLDIFRENLIFLHITYLVISVGSVLVYFLLEPYLFYSFKNLSLTENLNQQDSEPLKDADENFIKSQSKQTDEISKNLQAATLDDLSYQELRIAELSLQGYTYKEIANTLKLKPNTIRWYMANIYSKLQINSKAELFNLAYKR